MSDQAPRPGRPPRRRRETPVRGLLAGLLCLLLALVGCTDDGVRTVEASATPEAPQPTTPTIPQPEEPETVQPEARATPPSPRPRPGPVVLVHLEGPVTDAEATDVVIRTEAGVELERFRLPRATAVHSGHGSSSALINTADGRWARYDATTGRLSLLTFEGAPPTGAPSMRGAVAWWQEPDQPWMVRLDTGVTASLRTAMGDAGRVLAATPDGSHLLLRGEGHHVVDTTDGEVRDLPPQSRVALSADGTTVVATAATADGVEVHLEGIDGTDRRLLGTVPDDGVPVVLADGRVLVLGPTSRLIRPDGSAAPLPAVPGAADPVVAADGVRVLVRSDDGLVLLDPDGAIGAPAEAAPAEAATAADGAGTPSSAATAAEPAAAPAPTALTLPDTQGWTTVAEGPQSVLWGLSEDPQRPGVVAVDPATGDAVPLLPDTPTARVTGIGANGRTVLLQVGESAEQLVVVTSDGTASAPVVAVGGALHPDGERIAVVHADQGTTRSMVLGAVTAITDRTAAQAEVVTGRSPAWVRTDGPPATR